MKRKHVGSRFEDFLAEDGILEECPVSAIKSGSTGIDRLLDPGNTSITLNTMAKVAHLLGKRIEFALR